MSRMQNLFCIHQNIQNFLMKMQLFKCSWKYISVQLYKLKVTIYFLYQCMYTACLHVDIGIKKWKDIFGYE